MSDFIPSVITGKEAFLRAAAPQHLDSCLPSTGLAFLGEPVELLTVPCLDLQRNFEMR